MKKYMIVAMVIGIMGCAEHIMAMDDSSAAAGPSEHALVLAYASIDEIDVYGDTQLHEAMRNGLVGRVQQLLDMNADPNLLDGQGRSPFSYACADELPQDLAALERRKELLSMLYKAGAYDRRLRVDLLSPIILETIFRIGVEDRIEQEKILLIGDLMKQYKWAAAVISVIKEYMKPVNTFLIQNHPMKFGIAERYAIQDASVQAECLFQGCHANDMLQVLKALYVGVDVKGVVQNRSSLFLQEAVRCSSEEIVTLLLDCKAHVNVQAEDGTTPLHIAARSGKGSMIWLLLQYGADRMLKDGQGRTATDIARELQNRHCSVS